MRIFRLVAVVLVLVFNESANAFAQIPIAVEFGVRAGLPTTPDLKSQLSGPGALFSSQTYERSPYTVGPTFGVGFSDRLKLHVDVMYTPVRFTATSFSPISPGVHTTRGHFWEVPLMATYHFSGTPVRPYAGGGVMLSGAGLSGTTESINRNNQTGIETRRTEEFRNPYAQSGYLVEGGLEFGVSRFIVRPGVRYTHWSGVSTSQIGIRREHQFVFTMGLMFRGVSWTAR